MPRLALGLVLAGILLAHQAYLTLSLELWLGVGVANLLALGAALIPYQEPKPKD
jgi:hypothetical protein